MNITRLSLIGLALLGLTGLQAMPARAASHWQRADVACGNGLRLQRASGVPGGTVHTYVFEGFCSLLSDYDTGPWVEGHPPLSATARWDKASGTYTETLHLLAPRKFTILLTRGELFTAEKDYRVGTGPEEATFKCDVDPVINRTSQCTLITQSNDTGWGGRNGRNDGFGWKALHNQPLLAGRATVAQAAARSRRTARIDCRGLHLTDATGVPNGRNSSYRFEGTCRLYHTKSGSQGLQVTQVLVSGNWEPPQAKENVMVLTDPIKGGGAWNTTYTCNEDPWLNRNAQCSETVRLGGRGKPAPVYDPITDLMVRHPITFGMANTSQAAKLSRAHHGSQPRHAAKQPAAPPRIFKSIGHKGMVLSRSSHLPSLPKPRLTIRFALASLANNCDPNRLLKVNVVIRNEGGPLSAHTRSAYVHAVESGGAHLAGPKVSIPAISARETWQGVLTVGTRKSFFPKLPGRHTLVVSIGPDHAAPGTLAYIPSPPFRATVNVPAGYCQQTRYRSTGIFLRGTTPSKSTTGLRHATQQRGVQKKLTPVTPVRRLTPAAPVRRLSPAAPVHRLNLPAQLKLNR